MNTRDDAFERGMRQGLANAQWIAELAARDRKDPVEAIRAALVALAPQPCGVRVPVQR